LSRISVGVIAAVLCSFAAGQSTATPEVLALKVFHIHTLEKATIVFKRNGVYDQAGLRKLNEFMRDWRKEQPTKMDPHLFDLLYQVYQQSGSRDYIHIVCGYRSPDTNGMLRRRSSGVAKNSLHMQGKAIDFFIPGVPLAKIRVIGLRMQEGGVGFYPTSGSPFVHMDTGSVRHWPRMTHQQLAAVFPNGRTLYIPSDGKPLPGYAEALAAYKARKAGGTAIATFASAPADDTPVDLASADDGEDAADAAAPAVATTQPARTIAVAVAHYAPEQTPMPRLAPRHAAPVVMASLAPPPAPVQRPTPFTAAAVVASAAPRLDTLAPDFDFGSSQDWTSPAVPAELARAMAERDQVRRGSSLPIPPTAVVATIDVNRPLRAEAITTAVLRRTNDAEPQAPVNVMAYAALDAPATEPPKPRRVILANAVSMPMPMPDPHRIAPVVHNLPASRSVDRHVHMAAPMLTMTALDTAGLRMWIGTTSTRQKSYALLTMPSFADMPGIMAKPTVSYGAGFGQYAYSDLRTDRFTGPLVQQPAMVDLTLEPLVASIR
jgi:uncharacterized protein YcbK (DUF882 family)